MPRDKDWGSPEEGDATSHFEQAVERASDRFINYLNEHGPQVMNRPIGSVKMKPEEKRQEFIEKYIAPPPEQVQKNITALYKEALGNEPRGSWYALEQVVGYLEKHNEEINNMEPTYDLLGPEGQEES